MDLRIGLKSLRPIDNGYCQAVFYDIYRNQNSCQKTKHKSDIRQQHA